MLVVLLHAPLTYSDERTSSVLDDRLQLRLGAFWPELHSSIQVNGQRQRGGRLDFEDDLALDERKTTLYGGLAWRISSRHRLDLEHFDLGRDGIRSGGLIADVGDVTVTADASIDSSFDISITRFSYHFAMVDREKHQLGLIAGIHHASLESELRLAGTLLINDRPVFVDKSKSIAEISRTDAPLPHVGLEYAWAYSPRLTFHGSVLGFSLTYNEYEGSLFEANLSGQYQVGSHVGIGAGLKYFQLDVTREKRLTTSEYDFDYFGPAVFLTATF